MHVRNEIRTYNSCLYGITYPILMIMLKNFVFLWYDMEYLSDNNSKFVLWYDMVYFNNYSAKCVMFLWYDMAYLSSYGAKFVCNGIVCLFKTL